MCCGDVFDINSGYVYVVMQRAELFAVCLSIYKKSVTHLQRGEMKAH